MWSVSPTRAVSSLAVALGLIVVPVGCDDGSAKTGAKAEISPEITKSNNNMQDFMKSAPKKK